MIPILIPFPLFPEAWTTSAWIWGRLENGAEVEAAEAVADAELDDEE